MVPDGLLRFNYMDEMVHAQEALFRVLSTFQDCPSLCKTGVWKFFADFVSMPVQRAVTNTVIHASGAPHLTFVCSVPVWYI